MLRKAFAADDSRLVDHAKINSAVMRVLNLISCPQFLKLSLVVSGHCCEVCECADSDRECQFPSLKRHGRIDRLTKYLTGKRHWIGTDRQTNRQTLHALTDGGRKEG
jgi:hypothetical protein